MFLWGFLLNSFTNSTVPEIFILKAEIEVSYIYVSIRRLRAFIPKNILVVSSL